MHCTTRDLAGFENLSTKLPRLRLYGWGLGCGRSLGSTITRFDTRATCRCVFRVLSKGLRAQDATKQLRTAEGAVAHVVILSDAALPRQGKD